MVVSRRVKSMCRVQGFPRFWNLPLFEFGPEDGAGGQGDTEGVAGECKLACAIGLHGFHWRATLQPPFDISCFRPRRCLPCLHETFPARNLRGQYALQIPVHTQHRTSRSGDAQNTRLLPIQCFGASGSPADTGSNQRPQNVRQEREGLIGYTSRPGQHLA